MVYTCCVPRCRGNYPGTQHVQMFSFPKDETLRKQWIKNISRENFTPTKNSKVCEVHFHEADIRKVCEAYDEKIGKKVTCNLKRFQLKCTAVPMIFPDCPKYMTESKCDRESPETRRHRIENESLRCAIAESESTYQAYKEAFEFSSFADFCKLLKVQALPETWNFIMKHDMIIFFTISLDPMPEISISATVNENLDLKVYIKKTELKKWTKWKFPLKINDLNELDSILQSLTSNKADKKNSSDVITSVVETINDILYNDDEAIQKKLFFIKNQLQLISSSQIRYSPESMILFSLIHTISPHAYRFIRSSQYISLPHPRTVQKLCATLSTNPQNDDFSGYLKQKYQTLKDADKKVFIMVDEIYLKPYLDYKCGNVVGMAYDNKTVAATAHVLMIQSLLSPYKEVIRIMPSNCIVAEELHDFILRALRHLEYVGFFVIAVVTDNISINRKAMSLFTSPPKLKIVYLHPLDITRPLFYIIDSVHIFKGIRNNWLNQKNGEQAFYYPDFEDFENTSMLTSCFKSLKKLHEIEQSCLVKVSYCLNLKALNPTSLERQNVKLVCNIFNEYVIQGLRTVGCEHNIPHHMSTANFIDIIYKWWRIMNVKTPFKGQRLKDDLQRPLEKSSATTFEFLQQFMAWLDNWKKQKLSTGTLTPETHSALVHTTYGLIEMATYCFDELQFKYFLPGKVQTDALEDRFGKYRTLAGSQYLISLRQLYETESKLRVQNLLPSILKSSKYGEISITKTPFNLVSSDPITEMMPEFEINISEDDFQKIDKELPILVYISGYCARIALKKVNCIFCKKLLVVEKTLDTHPSYHLIENMDRGGLLFPHLGVVNIICSNYIVVQKLLSTENEKIFLNCKNHRQILSDLTANFVNINELNLENCVEDHSSDIIMKNLIMSSSNTLLNNYCKKINDIPRSRNKRKMNVFS